MEPNNAKTSRESAGASRNDATFARSVYRDLRCLTILVLAIVSVIRAEATTYKVDRYDDDPAATGCEYLVLNDCSLRGALIAANENPGADVISLRQGTYGLTVPGSSEDDTAVGDLDIHDDVSIVANNGIAVIAANYTFRVLDIHQVDVEISDVCIAGGLGPTGGGIRKLMGSLTLRRVEIFSVVAEQTGGAIHNDGGLLEMIDSTIKWANAEKGGGIYNWAGEVRLVDCTIEGARADSGGGIFNAWILDVSTSTFISCEVLDEENTGDPSFSGGCIFNQGEATISRSTFTGALVSAYGAAIYNTDTLTIDSCTFAENEGTLGSALANFNGSVSITRSLLVGDCFFAGGTVHSDGGSLESPGNTCGLDDPTDVVAVADPGIDNVDDNGGPTMTIALRPGSPAIDLDCRYCVSRDQRGFPRPFDGDGSGGACCDAGAFEFGAKYIFIDGFESADLSAWTSASS